MAWNISSWPQLWTEYSRLQGLNVGTLLWFLTCWEDNVCIDLHIAHVHKVYASLQHFYTLHIACTLPTLEKKTTRDCWDALIAFVWNLWATYLYLLGFPSSSFRMDFSPAVMTLADPSTSPGTSHEHQPMWSALCSPSAQRCCSATAPALAGVIFGAAPMGTTSQLLRFFWGWSNNSSEAVPQFWVLSLRYVIN